MINNGMNTIAELLSLSRQHRYFPTSQYPFMFINIDMRWQKESSKLFKGSHRAPIGRASMIKKVNVKRVRVFLRRALSWT